MRDAVRQRPHSLQVVRALPHDVQGDLFSDMQHTSSTDTNEERQLTITRASHLPAGILKNWLASRGSDLNLSDAVLLTSGKWAEVVAALDANHISSLTVQPPACEEAAVKNIETYISRHLKDMNGKMDYTKHCI